MTLFTVRGYDGTVLVLETLHQTAKSRDLVLEIWRDYLRRGDVTHVEVIDHAHGTTDTVRHGV